MPTSSGASIDGSYRTNNHRDPLDFTGDAGPSTPTTTAAVHQFDVLAAESSSPMQRFGRKPFRRDSSRINQWVVEQQRLRHASHDSLPENSNSSEPPAPSSGCHPYLAYPHLNIASAAAASKASRKDISSPECFVLVEEMDDMSHPGRDAFNSLKTLRSALPPSPQTPRKNPRVTSSTTAGDDSPSSALRNFHLSFASHSRKPSNTTASITTRSPSPSRSSILRRPATIDTQTSYTQTSSLTPSLFSPKPTRVISDEFGSLSHASGSSTWKLRRPTVLGHFLTPAENQTDDANFPRPSTSSTFTRSSATFTQLSTDTLGTSPKMSWDRSHSPASFFRSSHSLWSLPTSASHLNDPPNSIKIIARDHDSDKSVFRGSVRPQSGSSTLHMLGSPRRRKKRKLIVSGIPHGDHSRFDAVRKWCESFGQVNQITRMQNGDLHIDFRKNEVAETVCRLNARVYIGGVGSVGLSWFTGKRP